MLLDRLAQTWSALGATPSRLAKRRLIADVLGETPDADLETVVFPDADLAAIARGHGWDGVTVRGLDDLAAVSRWLAGDRARPLLVDAKISSDGGSWWLAEAFRGH